MQEMKLIDAVAAETAIKDFFKKQIDEEYLYLEVTDCNADISAILNALPSVPVVPLEVHERMKRELNEEIEGLKKAKDIILARNFATNVCQETLIERAKVEAIKDFAERIDTHFKGSGIHWLYEASLKQRIDNLVKEMAGDAE